MVLVLALVWFWEILPDHRFRSSHLGGGCASLETLVRGGGWTLPRRLSEAWRVPAVHWDSFAEAGDAGVRRLGICRV